ncbi:hypothetical protein RCL_jg23327.t1 [Rhizophagus clarus]|uniref:Uncharacterized protein n=1 Tax=Rhizophagus clarus TaxID=94130 RepID=A0A8H3L629_9GLOM|nr:hypothetical protein RCL_jg23327.t1 [Rhizophagus clarus]
MLQALTNSSQMIYDYILSLDTQAFARLFNSDPNANIEPKQRSPSKLPLKHHNFPDARHFVIKSTLLSGENRLLNIMLR